jgi:hypothetical protein
MIAVKDKTAFRTVMEALRQGFRHNLTTARTGFCGIAWVNEYDGSASIFRFAKTLVSGKRVSSGPF